MSLLIISATDVEAQVVINKLQMKKVSSFLYSSKENNTDLLVTGISSIATIFAMMSYRNINMYDVYINIGIAGSFSEKLKIGDIVNVDSDYFGDIFINGNNGFIPVFKSVFNSEYRNLISNGKLYNTSDYPGFFRKLNKSKGVTVNKPEIVKIKNVDVETMEGAAFMLVCKHLKKAFLQIRGISNIIGETNRADWIINTPIKNYSNLVLDFIKCM